MVKFISTIRLTMGGVVLMQVNSSLDLRLQYHRSIPPNNTWQDFNNKANSSLDLRLQYHRSIPPHNTWQDFNKVAEIMRLASVTYSSFNSSCLLPLCTLYDVIRDYQLMPKQRHTKPVVRRGKKPIMQRRILGYRKSCPGSLDNSGRLLRLQEAAKKPVIKLLVAGQPTTATSPPLGAGAGAGGASGAVTAGAVSPGSGGGATGNGAQPQASATSCCENGRPIMTDPVSGHTVCSCQYDSARLALSSYPRLSTSGVGVYGAPYPSTDQNPYPSIGVDSSAFYSPLLPQHYTVYSTVDAFTLLIFILSFQSRPQAIQVQAYGSEIISKFVKSPVLPSVAGGHDNYAAS
ncbi:hypothetical protein C0J52_25595 [Blattella germanica]|nr:hypothetical protein C0J52_25595 [Blattella germanica]